jgi:hypothetical protein
MTLALDSLEQRHLLKNTSSALACKKKMHFGVFFVRQPYFRTTRFAVAVTEMPGRVATSFSIRLSSTFPFTFPGFPACAKLPHHLIFVFFLESCT